MAKQAGKTFVTEDGSMVRSSYEVKLYNWLAKSDIPFVYEPPDRKIPYVIEQKYNTDFLLTTKSGKEIFIEVKGRMDPRSNDIAKYKAIKKQYPDLDLRFIFKNASKPVRKGAKLSLSGWCDKVGFLWSDNLEIPEVWLEE